MEEALLAALAADTGVAAIVADRIAWGRTPQGEPEPRIVLHLISAPRGYDMESRDALVGRLVQVDCWARSFGAAKQLARAVVTALDTLTSAPFRRCFVEGERDDNEAADGPESSGADDLYRSSLDVRAWTLDS